MPAAGCPSRGVRRRFPLRGVIRHTAQVLSLVIGYARVSRFGADGEEQRAALLALGAAADRVYLDEGLTGMSRPRPGLGQALAAAREGDTLVVTALARLARSVPDAHELLTQLSASGVTVQVGEDRYPPTRANTELLLEVLALTVDFQAGLDAGRTREGLAAARRSRAQLQGRLPKLTPVQEREIVRLYRADYDTASEIGALFNVSRSTVYRAVRRADQRAEPGRVQ